MSNDLQVQAELGQQLVTSLNTIVDKTKVTSSLFENQLNISWEIQNTLARSSNNLQKIANNLTSVGKSFEEVISSELFKNNIKKSSQNFNKTCERANAAAEEASSSLDQITKDQDKLTEGRNKSFKSQEDFYKQRTIAYKEKNVIYKTLDAFFIKSADMMRSVVEKIKTLEIVKRAAKTSGWSLLIDVPRMLIKSAFKLVGSLMGAATNFFKTVMTLPLMIANIAMQYGNAFRSDIIDGIGNAYQATKEYSDANSLIGKGISNLHNIAVGSLKTFENPRSQLVKLFGEGAAGAQKLLSEVGKSINDMGPLAELFGHQVTNSTDSALFLVYGIRGLGLTSKDVAYYALDAGTHLETIHSRLYRAKESIEHAAKMHGEDTKQVSAGFHKLRGNIKEFGHLTDQNLSNLVARMRRFNVGAEDLTSVFGKFKSFDEAAKTSAMLYQSFNMNIDALDLITAKDPGEIVDKFRDAMFATGKSYEELNRHEKQLMQQTTGMTDAMLKTLMTYQNMGLSYEEAKKRVANDNPTKQQIKAIKSLTSSITQIQRVMNFTSPFQAFMKGLGKNLQGSKKAKKIAMSLSKMYETFHIFGLKMNSGAVNAITKPFLIIVRKINDVFKSQKFKSILRTGTSLVSNIMSKMSGDMTSNKSYKYISKSLDDIYAMEKSGNPAFKKDKKVIKEKALKIIKNINNKEVNSFLKSQKVLSDDNKFIEGITLEKILTQLKSASLHVSSTKGKKAIEDINKSVYDHTDKLITNYFMFEEFKTNRGVKGQIKRTTEGLKSMFKEGSGPLKSIFDLGRSIMGGVIKGAAMSFSIFIHMLSGTIDTVYENTSSPIVNLIRKTAGYKEGKQFSILDWLGISGKDSNDIKEELAKAFGGLIIRTPKLFTIGLGVGSALWSVFADLASFVITAIAKIIYKVYASAKWYIKAGLALHYDMNKIRDAAAEKSLDASGLSGLITYTQDLTEKDKENTWQNFQGNLNSMRSLQLSMISNNKQFGFNRGNSPYGREIFANIEAESDDMQMGQGQSNREFYLSMLALESIRKEKLIESYVSKQMFVEIQKTMLDHIESINPNAWSSENKNKHREVMSYISGKIRNAALENSSIEGVEKRIKRAQYFFGLGHDEEEANKEYINFMKEINTIKPSTSNISAKDWINKNTNYKIKDGGLESSINSLLTNGGLKLFTNDGKIIVPHSLDELSSLSRDSKSSLINVFSNIASAYKEISTAVVELKSGGISRNSNSYEASDDLIDEMMNLVFETLEICINRDVKVNKSKVRSV